MPKKLSPQDKKVFPANVKASDTSLQKSRCDDAIPDEAIPDEALTDVAGGFNGAPMKRVVIPGPPKPRVIHTID